MIFALLLWLAFSDLTAIKSEPDFNKRSELALSNADQSLARARDAYLAGDAGWTTSLAEVQESVEISYDALLKDKGQPRKNKYFKRAELKIRALLRRLSGLREDVGFDNQASVDGVSKKLSEIHDNLLNAIMSKRKQ